MVIHQPMADELLQPVVVNWDLAGKEANLQTVSAKLEIHRPVADELGQFDRGAFLSIGFTHHMIIISKCKTVEERLFYIRRCAAGFWSKDALKRHLAANEYATEGRAVNNFALTIPDDKQVGRAVQAFRSEYLLDFVNIVDLNETEEERDEPEWMMEMVMKVKDLIQALGDDFCFMNVKKRFVVEDEEFFSDLVFYHRALKCMVAIELKKGKFKPAYLSQLGFYLSCLDKYVKRDDENPSIGLVLCHEMKRGIVELAVRDMARPIGVATYRTSADVPEEYKVLAPLLDGAKALLAEAVEAEEGKEGK
jgi:predicted nuclease of restriction endonuclease-like (RecB) superfamily